MPKVWKFKVVFVGDQNVGKTSIISSFVHDSFQATSNPTVGIDFVSKTMQVEGETLRLQLWDTAGQERFRSLIPSYVRDGDICLVVIDLGARSSFQNLNKWMDFVTDTKGVDDSVILIVGNKSDLGNEEREVSTEDLKQYCENNRCEYLEVSAKKGTNISELFLKVSQTLIHQKMGHTPGERKEAEHSKTVEDGESKTPTKFSINKEEYISGNGQSAQNSCRC